ncbi:hypothetical protein, partial [Bowmanella yangjiangensis]
FSVVGATMPALAMLSSVVSLMSIMLCFLSIAPRVRPHGQHTDPRNGVLAAGTRSNRKNCVGRDAQQRAKEVGH